MKLKALGTGARFCRHPLVTSSFLLQDDLGNTLINCGYNVPAKLESISVPLEKIDMILLLDSSMESIAGLPEMAFVSKRQDSKKLLVAPEVILKRVKKFFSEINLHTSFDIKACQKVTVTEEHYSETLTFVDNYSDDGHGILLETAGIFITGTAVPNDDFLHRYGSPANTILHSCQDTVSLEQLRQLPIYLQQKIWLYCYDNQYHEIADPLPMLHLPQGTCIFDSSRKDKLLDKERFIRESTKKQLGRTTGLRQYRDQHDQEDTLLTQPPAP